MKRINLSWTDGRDVYYAMDKSNLAHIESSSRGKVHPNFLTTGLKIWRQVMPPRMPHGMNECLGPTLVCSP